MDGHIRLKAARGRQLTQPKHLHGELGLVEREQLKRQGLDDRTASHRALAFIPISLVQMTCRSSK